MSKKVKIQYVTNSPVHFGNLKYSVPQGTIINYIQEQDNAWIYISDQKITDLKDFKIALKHNLISELKGNVVEPQKKQQKKKIQRLPVVKSDQDQMGQTIDISETKNLYDKKYNTKEEKKEEVGQTIRGLKVIRDDSAQIIEQKGIKMQVKTASDSSDKQMLQMINGKGLKKVSLKKDKKASEQKAKKIAQKRKKQSLENQKNMKKGKSK